MQTWLSHAPVQILQCQWDKSWVFPRRSVPKLLLLHFPLTACLPPIISHLSFLVIARLSHAFVSLHRLFPLLFFLWLLCTHLSRLSSKFSSTEKLLRFLISLDSTHIQSLKQVWIHYRPIFCLHHICVPH